MFSLLIILLYTLGFFITLGVSTWFEYKASVPYIKNLQPEYKSIWSNPYALSISAFSWIGVIVMCAWSYNKFKDVGMLYSYKELWERWNQYHSH